MALGRPFGAGCFQSIGEALAVHGQLTGRLGVWGSALPTERACARRSWRAGLRSVAGRPASRPIAWGAWDASMRAVTPVPACVACSPPV